MPKELFMPMKLQYFAENPEGEPAESEKGGQAEGEPNPGGSGEPKDNNVGGEDKPAVKTFDEDYVKSLRNEAATYRNERNQLQEQIKAINKALGLEPDEKDAEQLQQKLETTQQQLKDLKVENTFGRVASKLGADAELTLAVLKAKGATKDLDPDSQSFAGDLESLVKAEIAANPKLKLTQPTGTGTPPPDGGESKKTDINTLIRRMAGK